MERDVVDVIARALYQTRHTDLEVPWERTKLRTRTWWRARAETIAQELRKEGFL